MTEYIVLGSVTAVVVAILHLRSDHNEFGYVEFMDFFLAGLLGLFLGTIWPLIWAVAIVAGIGYGIYRAIPVVGRWISTFTR